VFKFTSEVINTFTLKIKFFITFVKKLLNMLDNILSILKSEVGSEILNKAGISSDKLDPLLKETGKVVSTEVKKEALSGGMDTLMNLFSKGANNGSANKLQDNIAGSLIKNYITKLGLSDSQANMVIQIVLPKIMSLITKTNETTPANDSSPLQSLFDFAGSGSSKAKDGGMAGKLTGMLGNFLKNK